MSTAAFMLAAVATAGSMVELMANNRAAAVWAGALAFLALTVAQLVPQ